MICQHISADRAGEEDGRELIMKTLKDSPLLNDIQANSGKVERREFLALRREAHESAESFTARALLYRSKLRHVDIGFDMGDGFFCGFVLDAAELTDADKALILSKVADETNVTEVFEAIRKFGHLLHGTNSCPMGRSVHQRERILPTRMDRPAAPRAVQPIRPAPRKSMQRGWIPGGRPHAVHTAEPDHVEEPPSHSQNDEDSEDDAQLD